jgi:hypothetical protein
MLLQVAPAAPATQQIIATGHYSDKSSKDLSTQVSWVSSAQNVATVDKGYSSFLRNCHNHGVVWRP